MRRSPHAPEEVQLRALLRRGRIAAGMTQAQVAAKLGKPQSFVAKYENGERRLDVLEFIRVLKATDMLQPVTFELLLQLDHSENNTNKSVG